MPTTQERARAARETDEVIKASQQDQLVKEREARDARLGIGSASGSAPVKKAAPTKKTAAKRTATKKTAKKAVKKTTAKKA